VTSGVPCYAVEVCNARGRWRFVYASASLIRARNTTASIKAHQRYRGAKITDARVTPARLKLIRPKGRT
jgi:hypothetical protein